MTDPEGFLSRWARRKQQAAREDVADAGAAAAPVETSDTRDGIQAEGERLQGERLQDERPDAEHPEASQAEGDAPPGAPAFDLSKLPSIDSITAETDIRPFLAAGVPASLRQAALRRVWVADPKIRDFIGIAENQWDFTGASEIPGFDFSPPGDVSRMVAEIFGKKSEDRAARAADDSADEASAAREDAAAADSPKLDSASASEPPPDDSSSESSANVNEDALRNAGDIDNDSAASQQEFAMQHEMPVRRRGSGSAMPR